MKWWEPLIVKQIKTLEEKKNGIKRRKKNEIYGKCWKKSK